MILPPISEYVLGNQQVFFVPKEIDVGNGLNETYTERSYLELLAGYSQFFANIVQTGAIAARFAQYIFAMIVSAVDAKIATIAEKDLPDKHRSMSSGVPLLFIVFSFVVLFQKGFHFADMFNSFFDGLVRYGPDEQRVITYSVLLEPFQTGVVGNEQFKFLELLILTGLFLILRILCVYRSVLSDHFFDVFLEFGR